MCLGKCREDTLLLNIFRYQHVFDGYLARSIHPTFEYRAVIVVAIDGWPCPFVEGAGVSVWDEVELSLGS